MLGKKTGTMLVACCATLGVAGVAQAECSNYVCEDVRITTMVTNAEGNVYVRTTGTTSNLNCALESGVYVTLKSSSTRFKEIYAYLLAFQLSGQPVSVRIDIGVAGCPIVYAYGNTP